MRLNIIKKFENDKKTYDDYTSSSSSDEGRHLARKRKSRNEDCLLQLKNAIERKIKTIKNTKKNMKNYSKQNKVIADYVNSNM